MRKIQKCILLVVVMAGMALMPGVAMAEDIEPPPVASEVIEISEDDILVIEPQFFLEFPFARDFQITFNFGLSIEVPHRLELVDNDILNFFLRFRSYIIPAE